ncbi:MAG: phosphoribosyltransferase family protein [Sediminibacterium sp.]|nr:phosphoribosyltransferase family protein [Sediminibacterium sp.]
MSEKRYILTAGEAAQKLHRMSLQLAENLSGNTAPVILVGIRKNGVVLAAKIEALLKQYIPNPLQTISLQMDKQHPVDVQLSAAVELDGANVVLIDDVANSGRTMLYALKPLLEYHPLSIQTMVLVERMHKLFPVNPDYVGLSLATTKEDHIQVETEAGEVTGAFVG